MKQKKPQAATNGNRVSTSVRLGRLKQLARTVARDEFRGNLSGYLASLIRRDLTQRAA